VTKIGDTIRDIRLVERIGEGGMGEVFVGVQDKLGRQVAVKALRIESQNDTRKAALILCPKPSFSTVVFSSCAKSRFLSNIVRGDERG